MTDNTGEGVQATGEPKRGWVLYLADPYCWWPLSDVTEYVGNPAYAVRFNKEPTDA